VLVHFFSTNKARSFNVVGSYAINAIVLIGALAIFNNNQSLVSPEIITNFVLIVSLAGGLELGLVKSCLVNLKSTKSQLFSKTVLIEKVSLRAFIPSVFIFLLWVNLGPDPGILQKFIFSYGFCLIGLLSSELRVIFNNIGLHSSAIWTKQGGITFGILTFVSSIYLGFGVTISLMMYFLARIFWLALLFYRYDKICVGNKIVAFENADIAGWQHMFALNSLATFSGNIDRILIVYFLAADLALTYFLIYEIFTKYWLIAYIINPIIFVRYAAGGDGLISFRILLKVLCALAILSVGILIFLVSFNPDFFNSVLNINIGNLYIVVFFMAIVINGVTQTVSTLLQSWGYSDYLVKYNIIITLLMSICYTFALIEFGLNGLLVTWLIKSLFEAALIASLFFRKKKYEFQ
tara:strand:+ start:3528 stop:4748 length:1221 start_codon:yes stop_codon:yes gene_type:complete